jgi:hypothetical protein
MNATNNDRSIIRVGDVMKQDGVLLICFRINDSGAKMQALTKRAQVIKPRGDAEKFGGKEVKFSTPDARVWHFSAGTTGPFIARLGDNWQQSELKTAVPGFVGEVNVIGKAAHEKAAEKMKKKTQKLQVFTPEQNAKAKEIVDKVFAGSPIKTLVESVLVGNAEAKPQGKCAFMRSMLLEAKHTKKQIIDATLAKFGGEELGTSRTLSSLPSIMAKDGKVGKWV